MRNAKAKNTYETEVAFTFSDREDFVFANFKVCINEKDFLDYVESSVSVQNLDENKDTKGDDLLLVIEQLENVVRKLKKYKKGGE